MPNSHHPLTHLLTALRQAADDPYESIAQTINTTPPDAFADGADDPNSPGTPPAPGTPAFHLHHTLLIFRHHARKVIAAIDPDPHATILTRIPPTDAPIPTAAPWSPAAAHAELSLAVHDFCDWLADQHPERIAATTIQHGRAFTLPDFLSMMTRHIVWHAAAAYYRARRESSRAAGV